jgi:hypothetical protein
MPRFLSCAFQLAATSLKAVAEQIVYCRGNEVRQIGAEPLSKCIATVQDHALSCPLVILALHSRSGPRSIGGGGRGRAGVAANGTLVPSQFTIQQLPDAPIQWGDHCLFGHCKS